MDGFWVFLGRTGVEQDDSFVRPNIAACPRANCLKGRCHGLFLRVLMYLR